MNFQSADAVPEQPVATSDVVLSLKNIRKRFGSLEVLKGVNLEARRGKIISLIGSSGSGKSTLIRCANLLETPEEGDIVFSDRTIAWKPQRHRRVPADVGQVRAMRTQLSMVFQQFNLWAHRTVLENVIEAPIVVQRRERAEAIDAARQLLDRVGILDKCDVYPGMLSGGQQQRAAIARALATNPAALLLDEPTSALDPELEAEVVAVIEALADEGRTMILVTHDMRMARRVSSQVKFLSDGQVTEEGAPDDILRKPQTQRLREFLSTVAL
ncbi:amino acid ABC transporter ATP-binding protein [uncultured Roseobacter sp.]|uniref:ATP-binding cassette domain-containing protein n=1 Tax=uncultured Roseobacter sp. TaxID=114847 RepID=UPI00262492E0|nr:amino acid ABC transporter ATP-binding protein [uncultured Roseobacter sp.]